MSRVVHVSVKLYFRREPVKRGLFDGGFGVGHTALRNGSGKFEKVWRRVQVTFAHGFG
jgi:hypothetical protein